MKVACAFCDAVFIRVHSRQVYCSTDCCLAEQRYRRALRRWQARRGRRCAWCGGDLNAHNQFGQQRRFCCARCFQLEMNRQRREARGPLLCQTCGSAITRRGGRPRWCASCAAQRIAAGLLSRKPRVPDRCRACGGQRERGRALYCPTCRRAGLLQSPRDVHGRYITCHLTLAERRSN